MYLSLSVLGPFQATLGHVPLAGFKSSKVSGLLVYLAVESDRPHRREMLSGLLWPERPDAAARGNLRDVLSNLRALLAVAPGKAPFLLAGRDTIRFNPASDYWLDATAFEVEAGRAPDLTALERAMALYRGDFLEHFSLSGSPAFEEWLLYRREQLRLEAITAVRRLANGYESETHYDRALVFNRRLLELEPWDELARQQQMRLLARLGQRGTAIAEYQAFRRTLAGELSVEPAVETTRLYERIKSGEAVDLPVVRRAEPPPPEPAGDLPFVGRERQLAVLADHLTAALSGQGRVVFVSGGAGSGKTALVGEFARQAMARHGDLIVAGGNCTAFAGLGDPYEPFQEILGMLTGDIDARRAGGTITSEHARRLWALFPEVLEVLAEDGAELVGRLVPAPALVLRARALGQSPGVAGPLARLEELAQQRGREPVSSQPVRLFEQVTNLLRALACRRPLVLVLDDLQWADAATVSLLFHLGRRLAGRRILVAGAYRPGDVAPAREGERHPLEAVANELQRAQGDIRIDLDHVDGREFVEALVDGAPNRLSAAFRETLYRHTGGNALFTVELIQSMRERGNLVRDEAGKWVEGPALEWERVPARVEAVIAEHVGRLPAAWQATLATASVEGDEFAAEVVASAEGVDAGEVIRRLSDMSRAPNSMVCTQSVYRLGKGLRLSRYRFRHNLFQHYLYNRPDPGERRRIHAAVAAALEHLYAGHEDELEATAAAGVTAGRLARHFEAAGEAARAAQYLLQAGNRAVQLSAHEEALALYARGLALLSGLPDSPERDRQELALQFAMSRPMIASLGLGAEERGRALERAVALAERTGDTTRMPGALVHLASFDWAQGEYGKSRERAERLLSLSQQTGDPAHAATAHVMLAQSRLMVGELDRAGADLDRALSYYDAAEHRFLIRIAPLADVLCLSYKHLLLQILGYPDQALAWASEALAWARSLAEPLQLGLALILAEDTVRRCDPAPAAGDALMDEMSRLGAEKDLGPVRVWARVLESCRQVDRERSLAGIARIGEAIAHWHASGTQIGRSQLVALLAEACVKAGVQEPGLSATDHVLALVAQAGGHHWEPELWRLKGELLQMPAAGETRAESPESCFLRAIEIASGQQAKWWELRAALSLARLWAREGRGAEARALLAPIYGWFREGFQTADLREARDFLGL